MPNVAIVTTVRDSLRTLKKCVNSIREHTRSDYYYIISDDSSGPETIDYLHTLKNIILIKTKGDDQCHLTEVLRKAFNKAFELGVDYICNVESDTYVTPDWDSQLIRALDSRLDAAGVVSVTVDYNGNLIHPSIYDLPRNYIKSWYPWKKLDKVIPSHKHIHFCGNVFRSSACKKVDFINRNVECGIDMNYSLLLRELGYQLYIDLGTLVYHPEPHSSRKEWKTKTQ